MAADLFRQTLEEMVDPKHPLVILSRRIPWKSLEEKVAPLHKVDCTFPRRELSLGSHIDRIAVGFGLRSLSSGRWFDRAGSKINCNTYESRMFGWKNHTTI